MPLLPSITITVFLVIWVIRPPFIILVLKELLRNMAVDALLMIFVMMMMLTVALMPILVMTPFYLDALFTMVHYLGL